ncbi:DUF4344 domain-containing metallopeptidase [Streptomyces sp. NPDC003042]
MTIHRWTWGLCAALLSLTATGCQQEPTAQGFVLRYEKPVAADRDDHRFLRDREPAEQTLLDLNAYLRLPHRVIVVARSCAGEGSGYDPDTDRIELCYDDLTDERELLTRAAEHRADEQPVDEQLADERPTDEQLADVVQETLYHEAGHALIDALDLPDDGDRAEEDAADRFAQLMLLRHGRPDGERTLLTAARAYDLAAAADPVPDPTDAHAPDTARAESHRCAVHGAAPGRHPDLATAARADCATTWTRTRDTWTRHLTPLLRAPLLK